MNAMRIDLGIFGGIARMKVTQQQCDHTNDGWDMEITIAAGMDHLSVAQALQYAIDNIDESCAEYQQQVDEQAAVDKLVATALAIFNQVPKPRLRQATFALVDQLGIDTLSF
jgi:hypothetical protein